MKGRARERVLDNEPLQARLLPEEDTVRQLTLERRQRGQITQTVNFEAWNPNGEPSHSRQHDLAWEAEGEAGEARGTLKKIQKLVRVKRGSPNSAEEAKTLPDTHDKGAMMDAVFKEDSSVITCIGLGKKPERKASKEPKQPQQPGRERSGVGMRMDASWSPRLDHQYQWNSSEISPLPWDSAYHTCQRPGAHLTTDPHQLGAHRPTDPHLYSFDFTLPRGTDWGRYESLVQGLDRGRSAATQLIPPHIVHSVTHLEMTDSTSSAEPAETPDVDQARQGTIGQKMKAISMTMRKRMGRKYIKALSEEAGEDTEGDHQTEGDAGTGTTLAKAHRTSSNSLESLYSLHSGQSSSSGITSGSEGLSNRGSVRLEEEVPYTGQFCGRARVHTDFLPSPYDNESLRLKVGDVIEVISKPAMGIWTGLLNGRVGSFKFIYVDVLVETEPEPRRRATSQGRRRRPRPNTLLELLACLNLEEHASSLMLNGYQTVDDLKELKEQHLIELNMTDPEHRHRLLAATECLHEPEPNALKDGEASEEPTSPSEAQEAELEKAESKEAESKDCPRDSGCYIPSDVSDSTSSSSRDDSVNLVVLNTSPAEA
ncbi:SAM domain-containing protein SAMSN-1b isoform X2 [Alosa sapidissima]|uniref:SAM domain-containing protein SAMSN-1b isoform X2 n=1 Tax=Alosa sapidissima TaxID=34773 RepID=UPI001C082320|nr:SAM domain-containing protein SAMSN-1b isoform X2 [Alosa sapidissima]